MKARAINDGPSLQNRFYRAAANVVLAVLEHRTWLVFVLSSFVAKATFKTPKVIGVLITVLPYPTE